MTPRPDAPVRALWVPALLTLPAAAGAAIEISGDVTPDPAGTTSDDDLTVADNGDGWLTVSGGSRVDSRDGFVARSYNTTGWVTVTGAGSTWAMADDLYAGFYETAHIRIEQGGNISNDVGILGDKPGSYGEVTVAGHGSAWTNAGNLYVGFNGGYVFAEGQTFDLLDWGGSITGAFDEVILPGLPAGLAWDPSMLHVDGSVSVVPEPATLTLLALGGWVLIWSRRRQAPGPRPATSHAASWS